METLRLKPRRVLCLGAHADDIEIGCGGTVLQLCNRGVEFRWVVFSATPVRAREAARSAARFLKGARQSSLTVGNFTDSYFPAELRQVKTFLHEVREQFEPDLIFTHARQDAHQDHRVINELTWNAFRNHLILEYEIPKYDGDLGAPNVFIPLTPAQKERKIRFLLNSFPSQRAKGWFDAETFGGLMRLRGVESQTRYAEAFYVRKLVIQ